MSDNEGPKPHPKQPADAGRETASPPAIDEIVEVPADARSTNGERQITTIDSLANRLLPPFHSPPSWIEWFGAQLAFWVLVVIGVLVVLFVVIWWVTLPSISDIAKGVDNTDPARVVEAFNQIRESHTQWVTDFFRSVVVSTLVPIFTLLAGYAFGSQRRGDERGSGNDE